MTNMIKAYTNIDLNKPSADYTFKNGDKVVIGLKIYQILDFELKHVADFIDVDGQETYYIKPGETFTYLVEVSP
jgi:hypothetical protein